MLLLSVRQSKALWEGSHFYFAGRLSCFRQSYFLFKYVDWSSHFVILRTFPAIQCKIPTQKLQFFTLAISFFYRHLNRFFTFFSTFFFKKNIIIIIYYFFRLHSSAPQTLYLRQIIKEKARTRVEADIAFLMWSLKTNPSLAKTRGPSFFSFTVVSQCSVTFLA